MIFKKIELIDVLRERETDRLKRIQTDIIGKLRWTLDHEMIFQDKTTDKFYSAIYWTAATEQQDESPFEYDDDEIDCSEVEQVEVTTKVWKVKKDA